MNARKQEPSALPPYTMTIAQAARELHVSENTARALLKQPGAPRPRILGDRSRRLVRKEFEVWVDGLQVGDIDDEPPQLRSARQRAKEGLPPAPAPFDGNPRKKRGVA
jgi:hypothetical protein